MSIDHNWYRDTYKQSWVLFNFSHTLCK